MNKTDVITAVIEEANIPRKEATAATNAVYDAMAAALAKGDKVAIPGFGTFEVRTRPARTGRNPRTGEALEIAESKGVGFKAGKALKDSL